MASGERLSALYLRKGRLWLGLTVGVVALVVMFHAAMDIPVVVGIFSTLS